MKSLSPALARQHRHIALVAVLTLAVTAPDRGSAQPAERQIAVGEARSFRSAILNEDREVQIALPETYGRTAIGYPVLFLLDGSSHLLHASATARFLASARNRIPEMIVVAIPNTNRNRDMTPGPGAVTFQRVLAEELIPWVERNFRTAPERILVGHSLSASFAVHTLLNRPELFDAYVAASAPLWRYDNLAAETKAGLPRAARAGAAVYLTVGAHENERLRDGMQQFAAALRGAAPGEGPAWSYVDMPDADHSSTPQRSLYDSLDARYTPYRFPFFETAAELEQAGGLQGLEAHYQRYSTRFGYASLPPEARLLQAARILMEGERHDDVLRLATAYATQYPALSERLVNEVGYDQLKRGQLGPAVLTFKANTAAFPGSPNAHDSLGDAYCRTGDSTAARQSYEQAARVAEARSPQHPRLAQYKAKAIKGCGVDRSANGQPASDVTQPSRRMPDGKQWTTTNLNVDTSSSYCYGDQEQHCRKYGRLYTWDAAQRGCQSLGDGWRLPTNDEWQQMAKPFGGVRDDSADAGSAAYEALRPGGRSGFDALLGGNRAPDGQYDRLEAHGLYWTASESGPDKAWLYNLGKGGQALNRHREGDKRMALSVRCVRE